MPQIVLLCWAPDYIAAHPIKHAHNVYFILFVSGGIGMFDRLNSLVCNDRFKLPVANSECWQLRHSSFNAPYNPVRLIHEKKRILNFWYCAL